ncbi:MAG: recombinase family protein [Nakamurella sp.]
MGRASRLGPGWVAAVRLVDGGEADAVAIARLDRLARSCSDEVLDQVLELRAAGGTLVSISTAMNEAGISTPAGSPRWWPSHVSRLLRTQDARARLPLLN